MHYQGAPEELVEVIAVERDGHQPFGNDTPQHPNIVCEGLKFSVPIGPICKRKMKTILGGIDLSFRRGQLIALLGPSGAGKTTLLNALSGRAVGEIEGHIAKDKNAVSTFITQEDTMINTLTPREIISYAAELSMSSSTFSPKDRQTRVEEIISELHLEQCSETVVGTPGEKRGISGGERKRVSIGMSLVHNPDLIYVDEPTSGLDSSAALNVVKILRHLADKGRTVIVTIHQPSDAIFDLFTDVCILARGNVVFLGPKNQLNDYFSNLGFIQPQHESTAAWLIDLVDTSREALVTTTPIPNSNSSTPSPQSHTFEFVSNLIQNFSQSILSKQTHEQAMAAIKVLQPVPGPEQPYARSQFSQIVILVRRSALSLKRDKQFFMTRFMQTVGVAAIISVVYCQMKSNQAGVRSRMGFMFFACMIQFLFAMLGVLFVVPKELAVLLREKLNGSYRASTWIVSKLIVDTPFEIFFPILFSVIVYWSIGLNPNWDRVLIFIAIMVLLANVGSSLGFMISCATWELSSTLGITPAVFIPNVIFAGFVVDLDSITVVLRWIQWLSFLKYSFGSLVKNEFSGLTFYCEEDEEPRSGYCPLDTGEQVLQYYNFQDVPILKYCLALIGYIILLRAIAAIILTLKLRKFQSK